MPCPSGSGIDRSPSSDLLAEMNPAPKHLNTSGLCLVCLARLKVLARCLRNRMYARTVRNLSLWRYAVGCPVKQEAPLLAAGRKSRLTHGRGCQDPGFGDSGVRYGEYTWVTCGKQITQSRCNRWNLRKWLRRMLSHLLRYPVWRRRTREVF